MTSLKYKCPFNCKTNIIRFSGPLDEDRKFTVNKSSSKYKFVSCISNSTDSNDDQILYLVDSAWDFDNVGVSKESSGEEMGKSFVKMTTIAGVSQEFVICRYLTCGVCDKGAIGFAGYRKNDEPLKKGINPNDLSYFVAL